MDNGGNGSGDFPAGLFGCLQMVGAYCVVVAEAVGDEQVVSGVTSGFYLHFDMGNIRPGQGK